MFDGLAQARLCEGQSMRQALDAVLLAYPIEAEREHLRQVILGASEYTKEELEQLLPDLAIAVRILREEAEGTYGTDELLVELSSKRRRT